MASYTRRASSSIPVGTGALSVTWPGVEVGDLAIMVTGSRGSGDTLATPAGWTLISSTNNQGFLKVFARIAQSGDAAPSIDWSNANWAWAQIFTFYGDVYGDVSSIVHNASDATGTGTNITMATMNVSIDDCMTMAFGQKFKTATSDGAGISMTGGWTGLGATSINGTTLLSGKEWKQQTTATNESNTLMTCTGTAESGTYASCYVALKTAPAASATAATSQGSQTAAASGTVSSGGAAAARALILSAMNFNQ